MKKSIYLIVTALLVSTYIQANSLSAYMSYAIFKTPDGVPYVETYLTVKGSSVKCIIQEDGLSCYCRCANYFQKK
jgi:hypothetical protein